MAAPQRPARRRSPVVPPPRRPQPPLPRRRKELRDYPPPSRDRLARRSQGGARTGLPWPVQALLLAGLLGLGALAVLTGTGALARTMGGLGGAVGAVLAGFVGGSPQPTGAPGAAPPPRLDPPLADFTSAAAIDITGRLPSGLAGTSGATIRLYDNGKFVAEAPVPSTTDFRLPDVPLAPGVNDLTATILTQAGESEPSDPVSVSYLKGPPPITLTTPRNGATVPTPTVPVRGTTRAGARVMIRNGSTGSSTTVIATAQGAFAVEIALAAGVNTLTVTAVDQAGNGATAKVSVTRGSGALTARLTLSWYSTRARALPEPLAMSVRVLDEAGKPVPDGSLATFTVSPPGQPTSVSDPPIPTRAGVGSWQLTIPSTSPASGFITVNVQLADGRTVSASAAFTVTR